MNKYTEDDLRKELKTKEYEYGFYTDIESETFPVGLNEDIIRAISKKKEEPEWMTEWRLEAFKIWKTMEEPEWPNVNYEKPDFQAISYYSAPSSKPKYDSLDEVDPEILATFEKLGLPLSEQKRLSNVAVDAVFDSVSVATTFKEKLSEAGVIFCSFSEAVREFPEVLDCYVMLGNVDFLLRIVTEDIKAYEQFFFEKLSQLPGIQEVNSSIVLSDIKHTNVLPI